MIDADGLEQRHLQAQLDTVEATFHKCDELQKMVSAAPAARSD